MAVVISPGQHERIGLPVYRSYIVTVLLVELESKTVDVGSI